MRTITTQNKPLVKDKKHTFISSDASSSDGTITVKSITGFSTDQVLLIGEFGNENSEIINTDSSTSPSGTTITLASNLTYNHSQGTKVYILDWNQLIIFHATATDGSKSSVTTIDIQADQKETVYDEDTYSSGYYFTRWQNSISSTQSGYSDPIPVTGYSSNTVGYAIDWALKKGGLKDGFTDNIDHEFMIEEINDCLNYIHMQKKKWHRLQEFDYNLDQTVDGKSRYVLPSNMWNYSNKSILDIKLEGEEPLQYLDEREFNEETEDVVSTSLASAASSGDTTLTLSNSYGFDTSGTVVIRGQEIDYTSNTTSTGVLSGVASSGSGSVTADIASGSAVWKDGTFDEGNPTNYTIKEGYLVVNPVPDSDYNNQNIVVDYWKDAPTVDSDNDTLDVMIYHAVKYWLAWKVRMETKNNGALDTKDGDYQQFNGRLARAIKLDLQSSGQEYKMKPKINKMDL